MFWKGMDQVKIVGCDLEKSRAKDVVAECGHLPFGDKVFNVRAVLSGMNQTKAARTFGVAQGTVARWMYEYR